MREPEIAAVEALDGFDRAGERVVGAVVPKIAIAADVGKEIGLAQILLDPVGEHIAGALHPVVEFVQLQLVLVAADDNLAAVIGPGHFEPFDLHPKGVGAFGVFEAIAQAFGIDCVEALLHQFGVAA